MAADRVLPLSRAFVPRPLGRGLALRLGWRAAGVARGADRAPHSLGHRSLRLRPAAPARRARRVGSRRHSARDLQIPPKPPDRAAAHHRGDWGVGERQELAHGPALRGSARARLPAGVVQRLAPPARRAPPCLALCQHPGPGAATRMDARRARLPLGPLLDPRPPPLAMADPNRPHS